MRFNAVKLNWIILLILCNNVVVYSHPNFEKFKSWGGDTTATPIANGQNKFIGCTYSFFQEPGFLDYWNQVTPENAGKWGSVEGVRDQMNWTELDKAYHIAKDNDLIFKLHVLTWGNQQPSWIENLSPAEQLEEIKEWFQELANRYPLIDVIEVVNEPLHDPPNMTGNGGGNYLQALGGSGTTGWDWVLEAFRLARVYFPNAQLMLNEYSVVNETSNLNGYLQIINLLKNEGLIDQIGVQGHAFSTRGSVTKMENHLDQLGATGLPIYVTELDIDRPTDEEQLSDYQRIFPVFWEHPAVMGITLWGFRYGMWRTSQKAYLIDPDSETERPALVWLRSYIQNTAVPTKEIEFNNSIQIIPNPASPSQEIKIKGVENIKQIQLFEMGGRMVSTFTTINNSIQLNDKMKSGTYFLKIKTATSSFIKKIIIQAE